MVRDHAAPAMLVAQAGRDLRDALGDPDRVARATDRLVATAESSIDRLDQAGAQHVAGVAIVGEDAEALLAVTLSQLGVAGTMFAASEAIGEHGPAEPHALDEPLRSLDTTVALLVAPAPVSAVAGRTPSATATDALAAMESQLSRTVDDLVNRSTKVIGGAMTGIHDRGPAELRKAWDTINERFHLEEFGGKVAKIALRAFRGALALLARIVPEKWLAGIRASVDRLIMNADQRGPGKALIGAAIGADRLAERMRVNQSTLDTARLDQARLDKGTAELTELDAKYGKLMDLCGGIGTAIGLAAKFSAMVRLAIPQLGVLILAAHVLVIGGVVVIGRDHVDAGLDPGDSDDPDDNGRGLVRGVRTIVAEATG
jgi:hypothetical protein